MILELIYFVFIQISLLLPGFAFLSLFKWFRQHPGIKLSLSYAATLVFYALLATLTYVLKLSPVWSQAISWAVIAGGLIVIWRLKLLNELYTYKFPLTCLVAASLFSLLFISLPLNAPRSIVPDPQPEANRNYSAFNVKVLNIAQTQANDNYVPYRQAQFYINRSDPAKDSFIGEWGVTFFERTPLMGAVTANYFNMLRDKPPIDYTWSATARDLGHTYKKFQILAQVLNSLLIIPGFYLISRLFNPRAAYISSLFAVTSVFFLYNEFFSWPKSLVAFFILTSWLLLLEKRPAYTLLAGCVSGAAYLTHDLAVLYIGASLIYLWISKRFLESVLLVIPAALFALPWYIASNLVYHEPSSFVYYPLSTNGIPQPSQFKQIRQAFFHTSPLKLISIRFHNLLYLLSPYQIFTSEGGQSAAQRLWGLSLFSISGAVGYGLLLPAFLGAIKKLRSWSIAIFIFVPVIISVLVIGWREGLGALHFAEAVVILLIGLSVTYLLSLRSRLWLLGAYLINCVQLVFFLAYSYHYAVGKWFSSLEDLMILLVMAVITAGCGWFIHVYSHLSSKALG